MNPVIWGVWLVVCVGGFLMISTNHPYDEALAMCWAWVLGTPVVAWLAQSLWDGHVENRQNRLLYEQRERERQQPPRP
jgi:hypothetical protein